MPILQNTLMSKAKEKCPCHVAIENSNKYIIFQYTACASVVQEKTIINRKLCCLFVFNCISYTEL